MRVWILLLVVASACSRTETSQPAEQAPEPAAQEAVQTDEEPTAAEKPTAEEAPKPPPGIEAVIDLGAPPTVKLLDAGKAPYKPLRTKFEAGAKQSLRIQSDWMVETVYGPVLKVTSEMPSLVYELETEVKEARDDGARFGFRVAKVAAKSREGVKPEQLEAAQKIGASLEGKTGSFSISPRGIVEKLTMQAPPDASLLVSDMIDQIKRAIRLSSLPLPEEPVGKGAKWTATQILEQRTAQFQHTSTYELGDATEKQVKATGEQTAEAPKQDLTLPGSRSGAVFKLDKLEFSGKGEGTWPLDQLGSASEKTLSAFIMTATAPKREAVIMAVDTTLEVKAQR
jgi:hypothetical protein